MKRSYQRTKEKSKVKPEVIRRQALLVQLSSHPARRELHRASPTRPEAPGLANPSEIASRLFGSYPIPIR
jgi:hypothetical protein